MRETAEAGDDVAVACPALDAAFDVGVPRRIGTLPQLPQEPEAAVLFRDVLAVMERVIEPDRRDRMQRPVEFPIDGMVDRLEGARVARVGVDRAAIDVPGELVEQQDESERAVRCVPPSRELARAGARQQVAEAVPDLFVDLRTAPVPPAVAGQGLLRTVAAVAEPEGADVDDDLGVHAGILALGGGHQSGSRLNRLSGPGDGGRRHGLGKRTR